MAQFGVSHKITFDAWAAGVRKTGDAANITVQLSQDGAKGVGATNPPAEILLADDSPSGRYELTITANEAAYNTTRWMADSVTPGVVCTDGFVVRDQLRGARQITITVVDAVWAPISGVSVAIYDISGINVVALCVTNAEGIAKILGSLSDPWLDDGLYLIVCSKPGVNITNPTELTVDGAESVTIEGALVDPGTPSANLCRITGYAKRGDETVIEGALVKITLKDRPMIGDLTVFSPKEVKAASDATGYFEIDYEQGATVTVSIMDGQTTCASFSVTIPAQVSIDIEALYALA